MREVPEWIGSSPDAKIPPRVRLRIWEKHDGRCHISGMKIQAGQQWDCEHIIPFMLIRLTHTDPCASVSSLGKPAR